MISTPEPFKFALPPETIRGEMHKVRHFRLVYANFVYYASIRAPYSDRS